MHPGDLTAFHRQRRVLLGLLVAAPLLLVGGAWWGVNTFLLRVAEPAAADPAEVWFRYIIDAQGLSKADRAKREAFFYRHLERCRGTTYAHEFAACIRAATPEERERIVTMLWDTFLPKILTDARTYFDLPPDTQVPHLDECIVKYIQLANALKQTKMGKSDGLGGSGDVQLFMKLVDRLPDEDQTLVIRFWEKMQERAAEIMADATLRKQFEDRVGPPK